MPEEMKRGKILNPEELKLQLQVEQYNYFMLIAIQIALGLKYIRELDSLWEELYKESTEFPAAKVAYEHILSLKGQILDNDKEYLF